jgi:hypothetical protein
MLCRRVLRAEARLRRAVSRARAARRADRPLRSKRQSIGSLPLDRPAQAAKLARRFAQIRASWPIYRLTVDSEIARRHALHAFGFYINGLVRPLIELVGMRYRPERFDYGRRRLHHDLPAELQQVLTQPAYASPIDEIEARLPQLDQPMTRLVTEIELRPSILSVAALR